MKDIISRAYYQRYEKHLEQQKIRADVNVRSAEENLEENYD